MRRDLKNRIRRLAAACFALAFFVDLASPADAVPLSDRPSDAERVCSMIFQEARRRTLPENFFARLIWKESLFDPRAVSPKGALGIAQFMPGTAKDRGLSDPFLIAEALAASADLLAELRDSLGNLGLAAAAYNAGEDRVRTWLAGSSDLPFETIDYVLFITGRPAADWMKSEAAYAIPVLGKGGNFTQECIALASRHTPPAVAAIAGGVWKPWGAELAGAPSETAALAAFSRLQKVHGGVLAGITPLVVRKRTAGMGTRMRVHVRIGAASRADAERFCGKLRAQGGACIVMRN
jgi:Transglycosylase SLT domain